jgi:hypothetical protein
VFCDIALEEEMNHVHSDFLKRVCKFCCSESGTSELENLMSNKPKTFANFHSKSDSIEKGKNIDENIAKEHLRNVIDEALKEVLPQADVSGSVCYNRDCFYYDKTNDTCVGNYNACTVKQTER